MFIQISLMVLCTVCFFLFYSKYVRPANFPPGPFIFPLVGSLPFMRGNPFKKLDEWHQKFGSIVGLYFGTFPVVILNDVDTIKALLKQEATFGRPHIAHFEYIAGRPGKGISLSEGTIWEEQRSFAVSQLKELGFGKCSMEGMLVEDAQHLADNLQLNVPISTRYILNRSSLRSLWNIATSVKYDVNDPELTRVSQDFSSATSAVGFGGGASLMPWLVRWFPAIANWKQFTQSVDGIYKYVDKQIEKHEKELTPADHDLMDQFLHKMQETDDPNSSFYKDNGYQNLRTTFFNIFTGGSETTSTLLNWTILSLAFNQNVQKKLQEEIDQVVGSDRAPSFADREIMPYAVAVLYESLRMASILPLGVPRRTMSDVHVNGFVIPKDTVILQNYFQVNNSKKMWGDPCNFRPERFMTGSAPSYIPFSFGKRACPGEPHARNEFFMHITVLFQKFSVQLDPESPQRPEEFYQQTTPLRYLDEFKVIFTAR